MEGKPSRLTMPVSIVLVSGFFCVTFLIAFYMYLSHRGPQKEVPTDTVSQDHNSSTNPPQPLLPVFGWTDPVVNDAGLGVGMKTAVGPLDIHDKTVRFKIVSDAPISFGVADDFWKDTIVGDGSWLSGANLDNHRTTCFYAKVQKKELTCNAGITQGAYVVIQDERIPQRLPDNGITDVKVTTYWWRCIRNCR